MKWGCCGDLERLQAIEDAGYDYIESPVRVLCVDEDRAAAEPYLNAIQASRFDAEAFNVFLPGTLPIVGPDVDDAAINTHLDTIVDRLTGLSTEIMVLGSGGARKIPNGWASQTALEQFQTFCKKAADTLGAAGITIVIEPLYQEACNFILTVGEAHEIASAVDHPRLSHLADLFHMQMNDDPLTEIGRHIDGLDHVHLPAPNIPGLIENEPEFDLRGYLAALKSAGYDKRISVEDNGKSFQNFEREAGPVLDHLKDIWATV